MESKLRVLFVGPLPPPVHGVAVLQKMLVESDLRNRFDLHVLDIADRGAKAKRTIGKFTIGNVANAVGNVWRLFWKVLFKRPKVVFLFISQSRWGFLRDAILIRVCRLFGARVVANLNGALFRFLYESCPTGRQKRMRATLSRISCMQVTGTGLRSIFTGLMPDENVVVTPNGIPLEDYSLIADARKQRKPGKNILYMGGLDPSKGIVDLIEAFSILAARDEDAGLLLAGSWFKDKGRQEIEAAYEASPFRERIEFLGTVYGQEKLDTLVRADVFAMPTWYPPEGQPVAILEAMASGLPVVSCDRGAITDMVVDGEGGFIVPPKDPKALAAILGDLIDDADLMRNQGAFNVERAREHFSLERFIDKVEEDIRTAAARS